MRDPSFHPVQIGDALILYPVQYLQETLKTTPRAALTLCRDLRVPLARIGKVRYFCMTTLEEALFGLLDLGGPGFVGTGSQSRSTAYGKAHSTLPPSHLTPAFRKQLQDRIVSVVGRSSSRRRDEIRRLLSAPPSSLAPGPGPPKKKGPLPQALREIAHPADPLPIRLTVTPDPDESEEPTDG